MKTKNLLKKMMIFSILIIFFTNYGIIIMAESNFENYQLPKPINVDMILEESIFRRSSVRDYSDETVSDEELSTILWGAYGFRNDGKRTIPGIDGVYGVQIYVLKRGAFFNYEIYKYDSLNHSLIFYKQGSYPNLVQYDAPIYLGIVWDKNLSLNENYVSAEIGQIGQNVYFIANALNLGTVANVGLTLSRIGLPSNEVAKIIMPIGHPKYQYDFQYIPLVISYLPKIKYSEMNLTTAIEECTESSSLGGKLSTEEQFQIIWSSYGYSYLLDKSGFDFIYHINRHRTVPSAHKYYPLRIYIVTESGIFRYIPNIYDPLIGPLQILFNFPRFPYPVVTFMVKIKNGDYREELGHICSEQIIASAPLNIISVIDIERTRPEGYDDFSGEDLRWLWYYEAGASSYNLLLEATAFGFSGDIVPVTEKDDVCILLGLDSEIFEPVFVVPVGRDTS
jgi:nitroreductase